jgi:hypothetical protein
VVVAQSDQALLSTLLRSHMSPYAGRPDLGIMVSEFGNLYN